MKILGTERGDMVAGSCDVMWSRKFVVKIASMRKVSWSRGSWVGRAGGNRGEDLVKLLDS
jgi:hypothetical protein